MRSVKTIERIPDISFRGDDKDEEEEEEEMPASDEEDDVSNIDAATTFASHCASAHWPEESSTHPIRADEINVAQISRLISEPLLHVNRISLRSLTLAFVEFWLLATMTSSAGMSFSPADT